MPFHQAWQRTSAYLWGIDLFNLGFYWEAHEAWEEIWRQLVDQPTAASWCKGLIKLAAAGVKVREGRPLGVQRHARRAAQLFAEVMDQHTTSRFAGLSPAQLHQQAQAVASQFSESIPDEFLVQQQPAQPVIVFPFKLQLLDDTTPAVSDSPAT